MKKKLTQLLIMSCVLALLAGSFNSAAQERVEIESRREPDGRYRIVAVKSAFEKVVKGAPYSATGTTEHIQILSDGNQIIRKNESKLYRDSEGRTRDEQSLETLGMKWSAEGGSKQFIFINDPVSGLSYNLNPHNRTAYKTLTKQTIEISLDVAEKLNLKKREIGLAVDLENEAGKNLQKKKIKGDAADFEKLRNQVAGKNLQRRKIEGDVTLGEAQLAAKEGSKTESLGKQTIEGIEVEGTRTTLTIPAGEIGNILPIEVVDETWYSPALQIMIMTKHRDPRSGETTYRLTDINRSEPDRSLFEVPSDYTIEETKKNIPLRRRPPNE
jgi:hypothetical protein